MLLLRRRIALLRLHGVIGARVRTVDYGPLLARVARNPRWAALVLDISSPGGSAAASEHLAFLLEKVAERKPVVAFVREAALSGGYMLACAAHRVVAGPGSLVGSIGVISWHPVAGELLARLGVAVEVAKSAEMKDMGAFYRQPTAAEREKQRQLVDDYLQDFLDLVARGRRVERTVAESWATGELFTARRGVQTGMVDEIGDLERALDLAAELARMPRRVLVLRPRQSWWGSLGNRAMRAAGEAAWGELASLAGWGMAAAASRQGQGERGSRDADS